MSADLYQVVAVRPPYRDGEGTEYAAAGGITSNRDAAENHRAYCEMKAESDPERYGIVTYVVATVTVPEATS